MDNRISCIRTNVQPGFGRAQDPHFQPVIKSWRCELTALSHTYNLYFVACNDTIYIYEPGFPSQNLGFIEDGFTLHPPQSSPNLTPHIDQDDPHSITRLHVDYLGTDEVVIVTCDDGDVIVYRVPEIFRTVESKRLLEDESDPDLNDEVRVFRHLNVGSSAWGIAVHREARLMAISANTHNITVLAFALSDPSDDWTPSSLGSSPRGRGFPHDRKRDQVIVLRGNTNIPAVSFDHTDSHGRWLVSSSIDGKTHIWDLQNPHQPARVIILGICVSVRDPKVPPPICQCSNRTAIPHAAWAAMFIDPRACHRASTLQEACGSGYGATGPVHSDPCFWDITETELRYTSTRVGPLPPPSDDFDANSENYDEIPLSEITDSDEEAGSLESDQMSIDSTDGPSQALSNAEYPITQQPHGEPQSPLSPSGDDTTPLIPYLESSESEEDEDNLTFVITDATGQAALQVFYPPAPDPDPPDLTKYPYCKTCTSPHFVDQPRTYSQRIDRLHTNGGPLIIITKEEIYLIQRPFHPRGDHSDPILFMRNPLFPITSAATGSRGPIPPYHRHCYATQIPELGIFIVATPAGRVGIFRLTRTKEEGTKRALFGFRLDAILPCKDDDGKKRAEDGAKSIIADVWGRRLVGIAVGPVQGMLDEESVGGGCSVNGTASAHEDDDEEHDDEDVHGCQEGGKEKARSKTGGPRRWRLMMQFQDHTIYSYELGKQLGDGVSGLGELVV